jgi:hypothetical protein
MSKESREAANTTERNLKGAEEYLGNAERASKQTGDKTLIEKVVKIKKVVVEIRKELIKKLEE